MRKRFLLLPLLLLIPLQLKALAPAPLIQLDIMPRVLMVNNQIRVRITVEREDDNRGLLLEWFTSPDFPNSSTYQLEGASSPRFYQRYILLREPGDWTIRLTLIKSTKKEVVTETVRVVGLE